METLMWMNSKIFPERNIRDMDVVNALTPLFPTSRFLGVLPYSDAFEFSNSWLAYSLCFHFALIAATVCHKITVVLSSNARDYDRYKFLLDFEIILNYVTVISHLIQLSFHKQSFGSILQKIMEIDTFWVVYTKTFARTLFIGGLIWLWFPFIAFSILNDGASLFHLPKFEKLFSLTVLSVFYTIVMIVCAFLEVLRCHLKCITEQLQPEKQQLSNLIETHNTIVRMAAAINEFFSWQILWICIRCSVTFVIDIFMLLKIVSKTDLRETYALMILNMSNSSWDFLVLFLLSSSCSETSDHLCSFNSSLFKIVRSHSALYKNEKLKLYTILQEGYEFNASGYFTVGYPLITSVIGATTTYVVMLVQFLFDTGNTQELKALPSNHSVILEATNTSYHNFYEY